MYVMMGATCSVVSSGSSFGLVSWTSAASIPHSYDMYRYLILVRYSILDTFVVNLPKTYLFNRVDDHANFL